MMKRILIFTVLFSLGISVFAQEYYRWYNGEKYSLILDPTRKLIEVRSPDDTTELKSRLIEQAIQVHYFVEENRMGVGHSKCWAIIENDYFPDFTEEELIVYEGGYFRYEDGHSEGGLDSGIAVKLKKSDDFEELKRFADENNVTVIGRDKYMPLWHFLYCTKASAGNAMQMANQLYETGLYDAAEFGFNNYGYETDDAPNAVIEDIPDDFGTTTDITSSNIKPAINLYRESASSIVIESAGDLIKEVEVFDLSGKVLHKFSYSGASRANWQANQKSLYLLKIKLQSGNCAYRKITV
jgi:hypothetical protein